MRRGSGVEPAWLAKGGWAMLALLCATVAVPPGCRKLPGPAERAAPASVVAVTVRPGGPLILTTAQAAFELSASGYLQGFLRVGEKRMTLDDPEGASGEYVVSAGSGTGDFVFDLERAAVTDAQGDFGSLGKRVRVTGRSAHAPLELTLTAELYDDFPNVVFTAVDYKNVGTEEFKLDEVATQRHRFSAARAKSMVPPYRLWSFHGASEQWGKDEVVLISKSFSQRNLMGAPTRTGQGGGIPVVAFWTKEVGEAIGHVEPLPLVLSLPVKVGRDERVHASVTLDVPTVLKPGETISTPRTFLAVYAGDFYEPLAMYSRALQRRGWALPTPSREAYEASWCSWGFEFDVTPKQMLSVIPKLKQLGIKWATLDDRWFDHYGDWQPRADTFPREAIKTMVDEFHRNGLLAQIWWLPIGVEDGQGEYASHRYVVSKVVREHPDWLVLNKDGKHARMARGLAVLCPALPEVQEYHRKLTEKFIRDWGFDGHKLDNVFTVPACYNPKHNHRSPDESIYAMGEVYRAIFQTTRALKPESVTQICPCGTPPNLAWLPYMDQAVTADPIGAVQVRRRIKMYKALLGAQAAVFGDHVELSEMRRVGAGYEEVGMDFASTIGLGGVVGTKFTWPDYGPRFRSVFLTPDKEAHWEKWISIYNSKMLSRGLFRNLYVYGYDEPEGYAVEKDGTMYYAFFAPQKPTVWKGRIELRGLQAGKYRVYDYVDGRDLGTIDAQNPVLSTGLSEHLLLEVSKL